MVATGLHGLSPHEALTGPTRKVARGQPGRKDRSCPMTFERGPGVPTREIRHTSQRSGPASDASHSSAEQPHHTPQPPTHSVAQFYLAALSYQPTANTTRPASAIRFALLNPPEHRNQPAHHPHTTLDPTGGEFQGVLEVVSGQWSVVSGRLPPQGRRTHPCTVVRCLLSVGYCLLNRPGFAGECFS